MTLVSNHSSSIIDGGSEGAVSGNSDQVTGHDLLRMPVNRPLRFGSPLTRLTAFKQVRQVLRNGDPPAFDNRFITRLNL